VLSNSFARVKLISQEGKMLERAIDGLFRFGASVVLICLTVMFFVLSSGAAGATAPPILSTSVRSAVRLHQPKFDSLPCQAAPFGARVRELGLGHNSFEANFRSPFGAVRAGSGQVILRFRTCHTDAEHVQVRVWDSRNRAESWLEMTREPRQSWDDWLGPVDYWRVALPIPKTPTILYYLFAISEGGVTSYYVDDDPNLDSGGWGVVKQSRDDFMSYQITVYDGGFQVPSWIKGKIIYQIFPDRFRNGNQKNDPPNGSGFVFGKKIRLLHWNEPLCDPRGASCPDEYGNQFYGGDLDGVIEKLDYLASLGVGVIYLNPIFQATTNHRYDTVDYFTIDPRLGDSTTFTRLIDEAKKRGIRVLLDGVFNHVSADSPLFDYYGHWGELGACESTESPFRKWFFFSPATKSTSGYFCAGEGGGRASYESWWGFSELPILNHNNPDVQDYFFARDKKSVGPWWIKQGAAGWRLDVGGDIDHGQALEPNNYFWENFRTAVKAASPDAVIIGEEWGNASPWLTGWEWDSVMNYRFRAALLDWLADGCVGLGCQDGQIFEDDDNRHDRVNGPIAPIAETVFDNRLRGILENYPREAWHSLLNLLGSHDTQRILFALKKISKDDAGLAYNKLYLASLFQYTYVGAPTVLYGDEVGVAPEGKWAGDRWADDPYGRVVYPWEDEGFVREPSANDLLAHYRRLGKMRQTHSALQSGEIETLLADNQQRLLVFRRFDINEEVLIVLNRSTTPKNLRLSLASNNSLASLREGTLFTEILGDKIGGHDGDSAHESKSNADQVSVRNGALDMGQIPPLWGKVFVISRKR
jgi:glycosidase